jgi:hypothetical protein
MDLTFEQRIFVVEHYFLSKSFVLFKEELPNKTNSSSHNQEIP